MTHIDDATFFPCPACGAREGQYCWPRADGDNPWCHTLRTQVMQYNQVQLGPQVRIFQR